MVSYLLIHGAGSDSWYWHLVGPALEARGHRVIAPDLPTEDDSAGLAEYTDVLVDAIGDRAGHDELIVVAQSMGGFTAPLVCERVPVDLVILVCAMVPAPGESPGDWWANTGQTEARRELDRREGRPVDAEFDPLTVFFHDVPKDVQEAAWARGERGQSGTPFAKPWPLPAWPAVPTRFLLGRQDRLFPAEFQRRVVADRLGLVPDEIDTGHLPALARPAELADRLESYRTERAGAG